MRCGGKWRWIAWIQGGYSPWSQLTVSPIVAVLITLERYMENRKYTVYGDLTSDKSSDNYPEKSLCDDCVGGYEVVSDNGPTGDVCEDCGGPEE